MTYGNVGIVGSDYVSVPRYATPRGLVEARSIVLKIYTMHKEGERITDYTVRDTKSFLRAKAKEGEIKKHIGMGFAILSSDMLNIGIWDDKIPHVLKSQLYEYNNRDIHTAKPLDIRADGAFCAWELGIVKFETDLWVKYLASEHTGIDKDAYLSKQLIGELWS